ncbi:dephospho-CoA kinase [Spiroplasma citri]|uniref:Dephospho-CoA kinase n=1 Tax=Spiroplasma citri TaxID=2133 RepID=A0AAX3SXY9_SPICI|nr:dephospho-CoA kinase [Spiroplasma citri]WFG96018.1 dephospho-CoA kinase [Spiroplasma citri]WFG99907.1 dephospho-CoA kinase [Spiroplasma citri]
MIIGVYGYIGAGKTTACEYLQNKYHFTYLNADKIAKEIMQDPTVLCFLEQTFPGIIIDGVLNRDCLRTIIFTNPVANNKLNNYLWPKVNQQIITIINNNPNQNFLVEAIGLSTLALSFTAKIFIIASKENIIARINARDQQPSDQTEQLLKIQETFFKQIKPDYKIITNKLLPELYQKLDKIMEEILGDDQ